MCAKNEQNATFSSSCRVLNFSVWVAVTMHNLVADLQVNVSRNWSLASSNWTAGGDVPQLPTFTTAAKIRVIVTFILCGTSAFCNLAVLWAAHRDGKRKSHVKVLIVNLTVADLLVTFIVMPVDAVWNITVQWIGGDLACRLLMFLKLLAMYSCAFVTVVISLDRQSAILNPLAINKARMRNRIMLAVAWGMSFVLSVPQVRVVTMTQSAGLLLVLIYFLDTLYSYFKPNMSRNLLLIFSIRPIVCRLYISLSEYVPYKIIQKQTSKYFNEMCAQHTIVHGCETDRKPHIVFLVYNKIWKLWHVFVSRWVVKAGPKCLEWTCQADLVSKTEM